MAMESSINACEYLLTNQTLKSNPNPATKQHTVIGIRLNIFIWCIKNKIIMLPQL